MRINTKTIIITTFLLLPSFSIVFLSSSAYAHRSGCHRWHSCPSDSGSYNCGDTGYSNYCGTSTYIAPTITSKNEVTYVDIPYSLKNEDNPNEYIGYSKFITQGSVGRKKISTNINYTNYIETSRDKPIETVEINKIDSVLSVGTRKKPTAYIDKVWKDNSQYFLWFESKKYGISAAAQPNQNFALMKNSEVIMLGKSDSAGLLSFKGLELKNSDKIAIGTYSGDQILWFMPSASQISETTTVNIDKQTVITEYSELHKIKNQRIDNGIENKECPQEIKSKYIETLNKTEMSQFKKERYKTIYYTELPCNIKN